MENTIGQSNASESGEHSGKSEADLSAAGNGRTDEDSKQDSKPHIEPSETEGKGVNPGRTPGKAEGVEDAEDRGNQ